MKDIPMFTTEHGAASLTLREIPYRAIAYVKIQATHDPELLIQECVDFCRVVGADSIYASGHPALEKYPFYTGILKMRCAKDAIRDTDAALWPVQPETLERWLEIYNSKAIKIPNAAWMTAQDGKQMLDLGEGYFVHRGGELLGIGRVSADALRWVASCRPGAGEDVVCALCHAIMGDTVTLEVSTENRKAIGLYEKIGFVACQELARWYKIY